MIRRSVVCSLSLLVLLLLVAAPPTATGPLQAQTATVQVTGTVVDGSLAPLAGAVITLGRQGTVISRTTSDAAGRFRFDRVAPGEYEVRATHPKAPTLVRPLRVPAGTKTVNLPLVLASPMKQSEAVSDAAAGRVRPPTSAPMPAATAPPPPTPATQSVVSGGVAGGAVGAGGGGRGGSATEQLRRAQRGVSASDSIYAPYPESRDRYDGVEPNRFKNTRDHPLSTFGADVDTASYVNVRRFLSNGQLPPSDAVRVEDFLNYFKPDYEQPRGRQPLTLTTEIGDCPWAPEHKLVLVGARARSAAPSTREGRNIVLLLDVSGSMSPADRLPMIKTALGLFVTR